MKSIYIFILFSCLVSFSYGQQSSNITGVYTNENGDNKSIWLFIDNYCSQISYKDNVYISTMGGPYTYDGKVLAVQVEYDDATPATVGTKKTVILTSRKNALEAESGQRWSKQNSVKQDLDGIWRITGRQQENEMSKIAKADRKTIKILVDGYFQWIAINPAIKGFYGTGGGKYTFRNGKYNEQLIFFSRDNARVGTELSFEGALQDGQWHHRGLSSKGDAIHEIWSREKQ